MIEFSTGYVDISIALHMIAAVVVVLLGAGVMLYERFSLASRRLALLTGILGLVLLSRGLVELATGPAAALWFRGAMAAHALLAPAVYALAVELVRVRRQVPTRTAWVVGILLSGWTLAAPTVANGVLQVSRQEYLSGDGWAGILLIAFLSSLVLATVGELIRSYRRAAHPDDRSRALVLAGGFSVGALGLIDFFVLPLILGGVGVTPFGVTAAVLVFVYASMRYRAFSPLPAFATERILDVMGDGVLLCDAEGMIRNANPAACRLIGVSEADLAGVHVARIVLGLAPGAEPGAPAGVQSAAEVAAETAAAASDVEATSAAVLHGEIRDRELLLVRQDGSTLEVSLSSEPLRQRGRIAGSVLVFRDISERLRAARVLRATEQRYHSLFWNNPALVYEISIAGSIIQANPALERALGVPAAELRQRNFMDFIPSDAHGRAAEIFATALGGEAEGYQIGLMSADGSRLELKGVSVPVIRDGAVIGVFGVATNITEEERVRAELELQRLEFVALFEGSPEAILVTDAADVIVRVNPEFTRTFGYRPEEAVGRNVDELLVPEELVDEGTAMSASARAGTVVRAETVRRRSDGSLIDVSVLARELRLPGREPQLYGIYRDISEHKRAERSLRERDDELRRAQRLESVGKLAGGVAHDFNNLVTVISGHVGFALELLPANHAARQDLKEIERAGLRAAILTQQLLAFSRRQLLRLETVDAAAVIADVQRMLGRIIGEHIRFETAHDGPALVRADRGQLEQLLVNLVVNARDAMPDGGLLTVSTDWTELPSADISIDGWDVEPGAYVRISVADTGIGMDEDTRVRAFDPFFTTKEQGKGTGLGLATVFGIAKQSGGHVAAISAPGRGTTIRVWLPTAAVGASVVENAARGAENSASLRPAAGICARVLVVEDEETLRKLVARVLRRAGHKVLLASDGIEALALAREHDVDLVLSDLIMPRMGGRELSRRLRLAFPGLPILLMSGYDNEIASGAADEPILVKPFTPAELALRVEHALAAARAG